MEKGDQIILAVDAKEENHVCDMTAIEFILTETEKPACASWNLLADIATTVLEGNPHRDKHLATRMCGASFADQRGRSGRASRV